MTTLIEQLRERAQDPKRAVDEKQDGGGKPVMRVVPPPAEETQVAAAEAMLGFRLPELLRRIYREVGNGGFGPGYGLYGVPTAPEDEKASIAGRHRERRQSRKGHAWPEHLVPLCDWGSGIGSYLDASRPEAPVIRLDPNMPKADVAERVPAARHYDRAARIGDACWVECLSLEAWLQAWVDGRALFYAAYGAETGDEELEDEDEDEDELA